MESFVSELAQEVRCSLCKDRFLEPKLLKCFHAYCKACIKRNAQLQPDEEGNIFKCPECSSETSLPELNDVDDLKPSPLHTRILKVLEFVERDKVCSVSKSHSPASWYCFACNCSMCSDCQTYHSLFTKTDYNHEIVSLSNLRKEDVEFMLAREENCEDHVGYKLDFFCQDCEAAVCLVCVTRDHCDHKTIPNEKHSTTAQAYLEDRLETLDIQEQTLSSHLQALENIAVKTRKEGDKTIEEVEKKAKEIIEKVQQQERELIKEIQQKIEKSEEIKKEFQCMLDQRKNERRYIGQMIGKKIAPRKTEKMKEMGIYAKDIIILDDIGDIYDSQMTFVMSEEYSRILNAQFGTLATLDGKPESEYDKKSGAKAKEFLGSKTFYSGLSKEKRSDLCYEKEIIDKDERVVRCQKVKWKENIISLSARQECQKAQVDDWKESGKGYEDCKDEKVECKEYDILSSDHQECKKAQRDDWKERGKGYEDCKDEKVECKEYDILLSDHQECKKAQEDDWKYLKAKKKKEKRKKAYKTKEENT